MIRFRKYYFRSITIYLNGLHYFAPPKYYAFPRIFIEVIKRFKGVWWIRLLKMRITRNFDSTRIIAYLNSSSSFVTLQNLKPEKLIIENNM